MFTKLRQANTFGEKLLVIIAILVKIAFKLLKYFFLFFALPLIIIMILMSWSFTNTMKRSMYRHLY